MIMDAVRFDRRLVLLVLVSFTIFVTAVVLRLGLAATPYETVDRAGRRMGFNDVLSAEHYAIMIRNFNPAQLLNFEYAYEWLLLAAHIGAIALLLSRARAAAPWRCWFFAGQAVLFPLAFPALLLWPFIFSSFLTGRMDREGFVDIPFIWAVAHPIWVIASLVIAIALWRSGHCRTRRGEPANRVLIGNAGAHVTSR